MDRVFSDSLILEGDQYNHIINSLRHRDGDVIEVVCEGKLYLANIQLRENRKAHLSILHELEDKNLPHQIYLYQALVEKKKMEDVIRLNTQLGVKRFSFFVSERIKPYGKVELQSARIHKLLEDGSMQSKSSSIPEVEGTLLSFEEMLENCNQHDITFFLYEGEEKQGFLETLDILKAYEKLRIGIVVGPEGGFALEEVKKARESGCSIVTLFPNILRTEVAAFSANSILMGYLMRYYEGKD
ncbi:MAG: 16S rRNA (uracil(1498)-N(3))-methyltransferase [Tissierellia bacterium]|nr:16S rRNA (uracil(1498)-N(3))-methyltransferase [Tissierellia bacterium]